MIKVFSVAEMVAAEKASDKAGNSYEVMMEKAGKAVADAVIERFPVDGSDVLILVGPGNNGGDGLVAGRYLAAAGAEVSIYLVKARDPEFDHNLALVLDLNIPITYLSDDPELYLLREAVGTADMVIDGLLGTGVTMPVGGQLAVLMGIVREALSDRKTTISSQQTSRLISTCELDLDDNQGWNVPGESDESGTIADAPYIVAIDCPSGMNCDTGFLDPLSITADLTVTFAGPKRGHFIFPGAAACGELLVADIDIGWELPEVKAVPVELLTAREASELLPERPIQGHKGTFGWVLIAAGSNRYWGAPALAGRGAYRAGSGLVALAVPQAILPSIAVQLPEATFPQISDQELLSTRAVDEILAEIAPFKAILVGPGLHHAREFMIELLDKGSALPPMVIDADGLNLLASISEWWQRVPKETILTPHLGEMARLKGVELADLKGEDRVELAQNAARSWNCILLLKGAYTVVAAPDGRCTILPFANPALATAGSGDVLSGIIVSLLGQGLLPYEAAVLGGYLHGAAAQATEANAGLLAREIADWVVDVREAMVSRR